MLFNTQNYVEICLLDMYKYNTGWGAQSWTKTFFFQYIGLHVLLKLILGLKSTVLCGLDPWLTIHSILTSFFLAMALRRQRKERHDLRIYSAASRRYSGATDGRRAAKLAWGVVWPFGRPTLLVEKLSEVKFGEYSGQSAKKRNSATAAN